MHWVPQPQVLHSLLVLLTNGAIVDLFAILALDFVALAWLFRTFRRIDTKDNGRCCSIWSKSILDDVIYCVNAHVAHEYDHVRIDTQ